jgi:hypothetical protein
VHLLVAYILLCQYITPSSTAAKEQHQQHTKTAATAKTVTAKTDLHILSKDCKNPQCCPNHII